VACREAFARWPRRGSAGLRSLLFHRCGTHLSEKDNCFCRHRWSNAKLPAVGVNWLALVWRM
jgi:hypothetical protein